MTLKQLEEFLKEMRQQPYVDDNTDIRVLQYPIETVRINLPVAGLDGSVISNPLYKFFTITFFPIL